MSNSARRHFLFQAGILGLLGFSRPLLAASGLREVDYYGGHVKLPETIQRIATAWEAQNSVIAMLGKGEQIVGSTRMVRQMPIFRHFVPSIVESALISNGRGNDLNMEALLSINPDVLFTHRPLSDAQNSILKKAGVAVVTLHYNSMQALLERTRISGEVLGLEAIERAEAYLDYFQQNRQLVQQRLSDLPDSKRYRIYHALGEPLTTSGRPSLDQDWMDLAGVTNIAENWMPGENARGKVALEQIIEADPQVIVAMRASDAQQIREDPRWASISAVRQNRVLANPCGMYWWSRETTEQALQFVWLASTLYPKRFADIDMRQMTSNFYLDFYGYRLDANLIERFLNPVA